MAITRWALFAGTDPAARSGAMASLSHHQTKGFRVHWRFTVRAGPRTGETVADSGSSRSNLSPDPVRLRISKARVVLPTCRVPRIATKGNCRSRRRTAARCRFLGIMPRDHIGNIGGCLPTFHRCSVFHELPWGAQVQAARRRPTDRCGGFSRECMLGGDAKPAVSRGGGQVPSGQVEFNVSPT